MQSEAEDIIGGCCESWFGGPLLLCEDWKSRECSGVSAGIVPKHKLLGQKQQGIKFVDAKIDAINVLKVRL